MGYQTELCNLLRPLGVYSLEPGSFSLGELQAEGTQLDQVESVLTQGQLETSPLRASPAGLQKWEQLLGIEPKGSLAERRALCAALLRVGGGSFTLAAIRALLQLLGLNIELREGSGQQVRISFPGIRGIPPQLAAVQTVAERVLPCHLEILYDFVWLIWDELDGHSWDRVERFTWDGLEIWDPAKEP